MRALPLLSLALAACMPSTGSFPSLAPRPVESRSEAVATPAPAPAPPPTAALTADIGRLIEQARQGDAAFGEALAAAERAVAAARGSALSSEAWVSAQAQVSALDAARAPTAAALAELDRLYIELADRAAREPVGGVAEAGAARATVEQVHDAQVERLKALQASLAQG